MSFCVPVHCPITLSSAAQLRTRLASRSKRPFLCVRHSAESERRRRRKGQAPPPPNSRTAEQPNSRTVEQPNLNLGRAALPLRKGSKEAPLSAAISVRELRRLSRDLRKPLLLQRRTTLLGQKQNSLARPIPLFCSFSASSKCKLTSVSCLRRNNGQVTALSLSIKHLRVGIGPL